MASQADILQPQNVGGVLCQSRILLDIGHLRNGRIGARNGGQKGILRSHDSVLGSRCVDALFARMVIHIADIHHQLALMGGEGTRRGCELSLNWEVEWSALIY